LNSLQNSNNDRIISFDYLRVLSTLAVIVLHVAVQNWRETDVNGYAWQTFNFFDGISRWAVPIFIMISGVLFLNREVSLKKIFSKYILRMVVAYVFWSFFYMIFEEGTKFEKLNIFLQGHYHMWFILMIIGLYMLLPIIKPITENKRRTVYFIALSLFFAIVFPTVKLLVNDFCSKRVIEIVTSVSVCIDDMKMHTVLGYSGYFVLGYYLNSIDLKKHHRLIIYALGILGFVATVVLDLTIALKNQSFCSRYYGYFTLNVFLEALAVFTWFKYAKFNMNILNRFVRKLSKYSFGAYLIHAFIIEQLEIRFSINTLSFDPVLSVISISLFVAVISFAVSAVLNNIPIVKKYLV